MKKITLLLLLLIFSNAGFAQFSENFDGSTDIPAGWTVIDGGDEENSWVITDFSEYDLEAHSGFNAATIFYSEVAHDDYLITPAITVTAGVSDYFTFWARSLDVQYPEQIDVKISTTGLNAADFTITLAANVAPESGDNYYKYAYDLSAYVGQTIYIAFYSTTENMDVFEVDDVVSTGIPSCFEPENFAITEIGSDSVGLEWNSAGTSFEIEYGPAGFAPGTGTVVTVASSPYTLTGLTPETDYDVYIRNNCGGGDYSTAVDLSFRTVAVPPTNDFCADAIPLTVGGDFESGAAEYTDTGATTDDAVTPECASFYTNDVWFSVVVPADGNLTIETQQADGSDNDDTIIQAFSGTCGSLTPIDCNDDNEDAPDGYFSKLSLTGLEPNSTIYVAVWQYYFDLFGDPLLTGAFRIAAYADLLSVDNNQLSGLQVYPNPVKDVMNISYKQEIKSAEVFNMLGQQVYSKAVNATDAQLDLSALTTGTYTVKLTSGSDVKTVKIVKQ
ncbi:choice-of-anchor J domain-containing protein [Flavobacterium sp. 3HN19-14]|uniref:choice-of-anchor J domain-containing protein n=1 Tax=Flavobacterium sp. 3HN19-14 TaxID=3448133 RepID=UPI003EDF64E4